VGTCAYLWEYGKIKFEKNHSDQNILVDQFIYLLTPSVNDDGPDAAEMAISGLQGGGQMPKVTSIRDHAIPVFPGYDEKVDYSAY
jgi:hypothetical protein